MRKRKLSKKLLGEHRGKPPRKKTYFDAVLRENRKQARKFGQAGHTRGEK